MRDEEGIISDNYLSIQTGLYLPLENFLIDVTTLMIIEISLSTLNTTIFLTEI